MNEYEIVFVVKVRAESIEEGLKNESQAVLNHILSPFFNELTNRNVHTFIKENNRDIIKITHNSEIELI